MTLRLLVRANCHLCEEASRLLHDLHVEFETVDVDDDGDSALLAEYGDAVPALLDGTTELVRAPIDRRGLVAALAGVREGSRR